MATVDGFDEFDVLVRMNFLARLWREEISVVAHFPRAGYFATPANAMPSPITSSSPSTVPRDDTISVNAATVFSASPTLWPIT